MAGSIPPKEREARRILVHDRHRLVFTIVISALAIITVIAVPTAFGLFDDASEQEAQPNYGVPAPCVATGTQAVDPGKITVRTLNATGKQGLGNAVASALVLRGFKSQGVDNYPGDDAVERTQIRFGRNAVAEAYTLLGNFSDAVLLMDDRDDVLVDVVVGNSFYSLLDEDQVTTLPGTTLQSLKGCVAADQIADVPASLDHEPVAADGMAEGSGTQEEVGSEEEAGQSGDGDGGEGQAE